MATKIPLEFKPLTWVDATKGEGCPLRREASFPFGVIRIYQWGTIDNWRFQYLGIGPNWFAGKTEEEAKAAAEASYQRFILSAFFKDE